MSSKVRKPLSPAELEQYEAGRDLAADLLQAVREMKAGQVHVVHTPAVEARRKTVPRRFVWNLTARIHRSGARWGLWATRQSELSTNPPGGAFC